MAAGVMRPWAAQLPNPTDERIRRGFRRACLPQSTQSAKAEESAPKRKDGLDGLFNRIGLESKASQRGAAKDEETPSSTRGTGTGLWTAFPPAKVSYKDQCDKEFQESAGRVAPTMGEEVCWLMEWFRESWPLEDKFGTSSQRLLGSVENMAVDVQAPPAPKREMVLVFADQRGFCRRFLDRVPSERTADVRFVETAPGDIQLSTVKDLLVERKWDMVVYGCGIDRPGNAVPDVMAHLDDVSKLYLELCKMIQRFAKGVGRLACLTRDLFTNDVMKHEQIGISLVASGTLWGMTNTLRIELEEIPVQYIDFEWRPSEEVVNQVASDLFCRETFGHNTLRILDSGRYVLRQVASSGPTLDYRVRSADFQIPSSGIIAITGGNGSLAQVFGLEILKMAEQRNLANPHLPRCSFEIKMLSRSATIRDREAEAWNRIVEKANELGIKVGHFKCDVSDPEEVERCIAEYTPRLTGLVHTAGVLQDAMLQNQTWEKFEVCLGCKSRACLYLHDALERHDNPGLEFFWIFSSNSVYGNNGQANYGGANHFLDGIARHRTALGKPTFAIQWGAWGEAGMAAAMDERMKFGIMQGPMPFFSNMEGFLGLANGIKSGHPAFCVQKFNPAVMFGVTAPYDSFPQGASQQCYTRNFTSELCPTPPPSAPIQPKDIYSCYRACRSFIPGPPRDPEYRLQWETFAVPQLQQEERDDALW